MHRFKPDPRPLLYLSPSLLFLVHVFVILDCNSLHICCMFSARVDALAFGSSRREKFARHVSECFVDNIVTW